MHSGIDSHRLIHNQVYADEYDSLVNCRDEGIRILSCGTRDTASGRNVSQPRGRKSTVVAVADESGSYSYNL
jgi:hypothetical protein